MSGYLARLAARGGGAPAAAGPRLPSRFEPSTIDGPTGPTEAPAPGPAPARLALDVRRSSAQVAATHVDERAAAGTRTSGDAVAALPLPADRGRQAHGADAEVTVPTLPTLPTSAAFEARRATEHGDPESRATEHGGPPPRGTAVAVASPRVDAAPPPQGAAAAITAVPARDAAYRAPEPDVVRVTIGRVEVRATIAPQTPAPRAPRPPRDAERALHDYLAARTR